MKKHLISSIFLMLVSFSPFWSGTARAQDLSEEGQTLQDYLDTLPYGIDDYASGASPGCIGDADIYAEFFNAYTEALQVAGASTSTAEDEEKALEALEAAKAKADAAIVPIKDGLYYVVTANSAFNGKDTMAWFAPATAYQPGWKKKTSSMLFMWRIKNLEGGGYSMQNLATGQYINHNAVIDGADQPLLLSDSLETAQSIDLIKPNGQFNIHSLGANYVYNIQGHYNGNGVAGPIASWSTKDADSEGAWKVIPVPESDLLTAQATEYRDKLNAAVINFLKDYPIGTDPGCYSEEGFDTYYAAYQEAFTTSNSSASEEECKAAIEKYNTAKAAFLKAIIPITDGYYAIMDRSVAESLENPGLAWSVNGTSSYPYAFKWDSENPRFIWYIKCLDGGGYSIQNYVTKEYVGSTDLFKSGASISLTKEQKTMQLFTNVGHCAFIMSNAITDAGGFQYNMVEDTYITIHTSGTEVYLFKYSDDEVAAIMENYGQKLLNDTLKNLIAEASPRTIINGVDTVYTIDYDSPVVTNKSQLFMTCQSTEVEDLDALIDGDLTTYAVSAWNEGVVDGTWAEDYHALRIDAGEGKTLPENLVLRWIARRNEQTDYPNLERPTDVRLYASNDLENWDLIEEIAGIPTDADKAEYVSPNIVLGKPYRYLNMKVIDTNNHSHYYGNYVTFNMAEFNAYPVTVNTDTVYATDFNSPIATDRSQLFMTCQSTEVENLEVLIDGDLTTYAVSAWNEGVVEGTWAEDYHALRIDAGDGATLPERLVLRWVARHNSQNDYPNIERPTDVRLYASNDLTNWDFIEELADIPTDADEAEYTSPTIKLGKPYRYLNMKVIDTNNHSHYYGNYVTFNMAEFNAYPVKGTSLEDLGVGESLDNLRTAIATAQQKLDAGNVTSQDIAEFRSVYNEFLLNWKDTTNLYNIYKAAVALMPSIDVGSDMFCYPQDKVTAFENAINDVEAARPFTEIDQRQVARLDTMLTRAYNNLLRSMIGPNPNVWYSVYSMDEATTDAEGNTLKGKVIWMGGNSSSDGIGCSGNLETYMLDDPRRAWKFEPTTTPNVYNMICAANGWPINRGPVRLVGLGEGQFAIYTGTNFDMLYLNEPDLLPGVPFRAGAVPAKDGKGAWAMEEAPANLSYTMRLKQGSVTAMVFPFDTYSVPAGVNGEPVNAYSVCGYEVSGDGKTVTGINLSEWTEEGIKAGTPFVVVVDGSQPYKKDSTVTVDFFVKVGGTVSQALSPQNGLFGTFEGLALQKDMISFRKDSAYVEPANFLISNQSAYLNINAVTNTAAKVAKTVPVNGMLTAPTIVGITSITGNDRIVSVYTTDGVLVRKNVDVSKAVKGLKKGIYIIGTKKVLVK